MLCPRFVSLYFFICCKHFLNEKHNKKIIIVKEKRRNNINFPLTVQAHTHTQMKKKKIMAFKTFENCFFLHFFLLLFFILVESVNYKKTKEKIMVKGRNGEDEWMIYQHKQTHKKCLNGMRASAAKKCEKGFLCSHWTTP